MRARPFASRADEYLRAAAREGSFSGSVLVARGRLLLSKGYGVASYELNVPNTPRTKFRLGSLAKRFTAVAMMLLQGRGRLDVRAGVCQ